MSKGRGCIPCGKVIAPSNVLCKSFSMCVGNYTFHWDGECASIQPRKYQIKDGTYTSLTFKDGCIVDVGQAPIPLYTPQACCGSESTENTGGSTGSLTKGNTAGNLVQIMNGAISVEPEWLNGTVKVSGNGTATKPWQADVAISKSAGNSLSVKEDGLFAKLAFSSSSTVKVTGKGTEREPYKLDVKGAKAELETVNDKEVEGSGYEIDVYGRVKVDDGLKFVTNLKFEPSDLFVVQDKGPDTLVMVNVEALRSYPLAIDTTFLKGKGSKADPIAVDMDKIVAHLKKLGFKQT